MDTRDSSTVKGAAAALGSSASAQLGAGFAARAFPVMGPAGVVAVRQLVAAIGLLLIARPSVRRLSWSQWWPVLLLALVFATMNLSLYIAMERIGLGLAVTLEFLGPLAVALLGSKRRSDLLIALVAGFGVYVLILPDASSDLVGISLALLAATCWAGYILLNRIAGQRHRGVTAPALASTISAILYLPVLAVLLGQGQIGGVSLLYAIGAGVLSSVLPYAIDLTVLRTIPPRLFGVLMSVQPVLAALAGLILLGQVPAGHEWIGMAIIAGANAVAVSIADTRSRQPVVVEEEAAVPALAV